MFISGHEAINVTGPDGRYVQGSQFAANKPKYNRRKAKANKRKRKSRRNNRRSKPSDSPNESNRSTEASSPVKNEPTEPKSEDIKSWYPWIQYHSITFTWWSFCNLLNMISNQLFLDKIFWTFLCLWFVPFNLTGLFGVKYQLEIPMEFCSKTMPFFMMWVFFFYWCYYEILSLKPPFAIYEQNH